MVTGCAAASSGFDSVVELYRPRVFAFLLACLRDRDTAENLTQDCFLKAYLAQSSFRSDCSVSTWLMQIALNLVRDHSRNRRVRFHRIAAPLETERRSRIASDAKSPEDLALVNEKVEAVLAAAAELSEKQRTVFLLRFFEEMEVSEIAVTTGMHPTTIKTHLFRALASVRHRLTDRANGYMAAAMLLVCLFGGFLYHQHAVEAAVKDAALLQRIETQVSQDTPSIVCSARKFRPGRRHFW